MEDNQFLEEAQIESLLMPLTYHILFVMTICIVNTENWIVFLILRVDFTIVNGNLALFSYGEHYCIRTSSI